ncbi:MAG TPA: SET domain-containing protein [Gammaproteobacteria bacterium]|jgi:SET domain-containing protein|nr:SET domain-containing protein [Gammaproteobacteria bacterium]
MKTQSKTSNPLVIRKGIEGRGVFATKRISKNTIIFKMHGDFVNSPTQTSVQIGEKLHIEDALAGLLNHSCNPTAKVDRQLQALISLRDIEEGEEITFDYRMNEEHLAAPFICRCCGKMINGKNNSK